MSFQVKLNSVDISARIVSGPVVHKNDVLHGKISPNECSFDIDNTNLAYTVSNLDIEGQLVEVWVNSIKQFTGYAEKPILTRNGRRVTIKAFDKMKQLQKLKCADKMFIGSTADAILTWLVGTCGGIGSGSRNLDSIVVTTGAGTTQAIVGYALYSIKDKLTDRLQEIVDSVGGTMWFDETGVLQFRAGFAATWSTSTVGTITVSKLKDIDSLQWLPSEGDRVIVKSKNRSVKTKKEPIFTWAGTVPPEGLPTGKDENGNPITDDQWRAKFDSPAIEVDDYATVNAAKEFDSGLTLNETVYNSNFAAGVLKYPDFMYLQIDNSSGVGKNVTKLVIQGKPVVENYLEVIYDAGSFDVEREVSNDLISSKVWASSLAKWLYENGNDKFEVVVPLADFSLGLGWKVGNKVNIVDASTGLSHRAWVREIDIDYRNRNMTVTLRSDRASAFVYTPPPGSTTGPGTNIPYDPQFGDGSAPATPTGLALNTSFVNGKSYIYASWAANTETDIKGYQLRWSYDKIEWFLNGFTSETAMDFEVAPYKTVYVQIRSTDIEGYESDWSARISIISAKDSEAPSAPASISATAGIESIEVSWAYVDAKDLDYYIVERAPSPYSSWTEIAKTKANKLVDLGVTAGTFYKYRVKAVDTTANASSMTTLAAGIAAEKGIVTDDTDPSVPTGLNATTVFNNNRCYITAYWTAVADADLKGYEVRWCYGDFNWYVAGFTVEVSHTFEVKENKTIWIQVRSTDIEGRESAWSSTKSVLSAKDTIPPPAPSSITATGGIEAIEIDWSEVTAEDLDKYILERSVSPYTSWTEVARVKADICVDLGVTPNTAYKYRVKAVDVTGNTSGYTTMSGTVMASKAVGDGVAPATPTGLALSTFFSDGKTYVKAAWSANTETDIKGYEVAWSYDGTNWYNSGLTTETSLVIEVKAGVTVYVKVKAKDIEGLESEWSTRQSIVSAQDTTIPANLTSISAAGGFDLIYVSWVHTKPSDFSHYIVQRAPSPYTVWTEVAVVQSKEFIDKNVTAGTYYKYRVKAYDIYGNESTSWVTTSTGVTCSSISSELSDLEGELSTLDGELSGLAGELSTLESELSTLDGELSGLAGELSTLESELENLQFADIGGTITEVQIGDDTVSAPKLKSNSVESAKIKAGAVTAEKIYALAVTTEKLNALAVTAEKIAAGAVTAEKIYAGAVTADKIYAGAVTADKIYAGAVTTDKIYAGAVVAAKIATDAIEANHIKAGEISANKLNATLDLSVGRIIQVGSNVQLGKGVGPAGLTGDGIYVSENGYFRINSGLFMDEGLWMGKSLGERIHPFMTSNTTPSGYEVSKNDGNTYAWYLFRKSTSAPISHYVNHWSQIKLPVRKVLKTYNIFSYTSSHCASGWKIQGSNDGTNWTDLDTQSGVLAWSGWLLSDVSISSPGAYLYYRLLITAVTGSYASISSIKLFDAAGWKFSLVGAGSDPNFFAWDGQLNLKGNLILATDENVIEFEDSGIELGDGAPSSGENFIYFKRGRTGEYISWLSEYLIEAAERNSFGVLANEYVDATFSLNVMASDTVEANNKAYLKAELRNTSSANTMTALMEIIRLGSASTHGYFKFSHPINVLYPTSQDASDMPQGTILIQGNDLYFKDNSGASGAWKKVSASLASPS